MVPTFTNEWVGQFIDTRSRYRIEHPLGRRVYCAMDVLYGDLVAVKLLRKTACPEDQEPFAYEIALYRALGGEHVVQIRDYGISIHGVFFYVMEYLPGRNLKGLQQEKQRFSVSATLAIATQICDGLCVCHHGLLLPHWDLGTSLVPLAHRKLHPEHILLLPNDRVKLISFGFTVEAEETPSKHQNHQTTIVTEPNRNYRYCAPEQLDRSLGDARSDIYALGMILYEMLSGTDPFGLGYKEGLPWIMAHVASPPAPLCSQPGCAELPVKLERIIEKCLAKDPDDRYPNALELCRMLQELQATSTNPGEEVTSVITIPPQPDSKEDDGDLHTVPLAKGQDRGMFPPSFFSPVSTEPLAFREAISTKTTEYEQPHRQEQTFFHAPSTVADIPVELGQETKQTSAVILGVVIGLVASAMIVGFYASWTKFRYKAPPLPEPTSTIAPPLSPSPGIAPGFDLTFSDGNLRVFLPAYFSSR